MDVVVFQMFISKHKNKMLELSKTTSISWESIGEIINLDPKKVTREEFVKKINQIQSRWLGRLGIDGFNDRIIESADEGRLYISASGIQLIQPDLDTLRHLQICTDFSFQKYIHYICGKYSTMWRFHPDRPKSDTRNTNEFNQHDFRPEIYESPLNWMYLRGTSMGNKWIYEQSPISEEILREIQALIDGVEKIIQLFLLEKTNLVSTIGVKAASDRIISTENIGGRNL